MALAEDVGARDPPTAVVVGEGGTHKVALGARSARREAGLGLLAVSAKARDGAHVARLLVKVVGVDEVGEAHLWGEE